MAVGGNQRYPSLQSIADLFRNSINDDMSGATDTPGEGLIATNVSPFLLNFMNAAIDDVFTDLANVGDSALILDNYLLLGLPALSVPNPLIQVSLSYAGFFDGYQWHSRWVLPLGLQRLFRVWERLSGTNDSMHALEPAPMGLAPVHQGDRMGSWEMRQNSLWMPGALTSRDLRMRCQITLPEFLNPATLNFSTSYVPILGCKNAVVAKMLVLYARRFAPDQYATAQAEDDKYMGKLRLSIVRQQQWIENMRAQYGDAATADFCWLWQL